MNLKELTKSIESGVFKDQILELKKKRSKECAKIQIKREIIKYIRESIKEEYSEIRRLNKEIDQIPSKKHLTFLYLLSAYIKGKSHLKKVGLGSLYRLCDLHFPNMLKAFSIIKHNPPIKDGSIDWDDSYFLPLLETLRKEYKWINTLIETREFNIGDQDEQN